MLFRSAVIESSLNGGCRQAKVNSDTPKQHFLSLSSDTPPPQVLGIEVQPPVFCTWCSLYYQASATHSYRGWASPFCADWWAWCWEALDVAMHDSLAANVLNTHAYLLCIALRMSLFQRSRPAYSSDLRVVAAYRATISQLHHSLSFSLDSFLVRNSDWLLDYYSTRLLVDLVYWIGYHWLQFCLDYRSQLPKSSHNTL